MGINKPASETRARLFGNAIAAVSAQKAGRKVVNTNSNVSGLSMRVNSKALRKSIFERMEPLPAVTARHQSYGTKQTRRRNGDRPTSKVVISASSRSIVSRDPDDADDDSWGTVADFPIAAGSKAFVRNLPRGTDELKIKALLKKAGIKDVMSIQVDSGPVTTASVEFKTKGSAAEFAKKIDRNTLGGQTIKVAVVDEAAQPSSVVSIQEPELF